MVNGKSGLWLLAFGLCTLSFVLCTLLSYLLRVTASALAQSSKFKVQSTRVKDQRLKTKGQRPDLPFTIYRLRHSRVGSSSGSGVSCGGRNLSCTLRRFTRMRVHVDDLPRMESISTSSTARSLFTSGYLLFHLSRPARAASLSGEFAITKSGALVRALFSLVFFTTERAREGATRGASPAILRKCGGQGASPRLTFSSCAASSSSRSSEPGSASMSACGSPNSANRLGIVSTVKSAGSQSGT